MENKYVQFSKHNPFGSQAKMVMHIDRLNQYMSTGDTWPIFMEISLTNKCPLNCRWCISQNMRGTESVDIGKLKEFLTDFRSKGGKAVTFSGGGEPTFYAHFHEATVAAATVGLELGLMTAGTFDAKHVRLIGEYYKWARFSLDTVDSQQYKEWKGNDYLDVVLANLESLKKYPVRVGVNCNVSTEHRVAGIKELITRVSQICDYIQFRPVLPRYFKNEEPELNDRVWGYLRDTYGWQQDGRINLSSDKLNDMRAKSFFPFRSCEGHVFEPVLMANGDIAACMYHPDDGRFVFGNINEERFEKIWVSKRRKAAVEVIRQLNYKEECQACCKCTEINKLIDYLTHPAEVVDINFL